LAYISLQTSTHVAPVSWANRVSGIRIAAWVEPPAVTTSSKRFSAMSKNTGSSRLLYQFATGGLSSFHRCWPSGWEDRRVHWLSFNFLQPSRATNMVYPLLVLPSLSL